MRKRGGGGEGQTTLGVSQESGLLVTGNGKKEEEKSRG